MKSKRLYLQALRTELSYQLSCLPWIHKDLIIALCHRIDNEVVLPPSCQGVNVAIPLLRGHRKCFVVLWGNNYARDSPEYLKNMEEQCL